MQLADVQQVYFIGIGGIGMSAVARYFNGQGIPVAGYDKTRTVLTDALEAEGMDIHFGEAKVDLVPAPSAGLLVVWTPAIPKDFPELVKVQTEGYNLMKRAAVLGLLSKSLDCVAIAGTHGKTTTTTITTKLMTVAGLAPHAFLGGIPRDFAGNYVAGDSNWVVAEADEYDRSFLQLDPAIAVILSADPDHLDIYGDHANMLETGFRAFARRIRKGGTLLVRYDVVEDFEDVFLSPNPSPEERGDESARFARKGAGIGATNKTMSAKNYWEVPVKSYGIVLGFAKEMRSNPTEAEKKLWGHLRAGMTGYKFVRQKPMGLSIPDFVCLQKRVVVEIDGGYHQAPDVLLSDKLRGEKFAKAGYLTLRFTNEEVLTDVIAVVKKIKKTLENREDRPYLFPTEEIESIVAEDTITSPLSSGEGPGERSLFTFGIDTGDYAAHKVHVKDGAFHFDFHEPDGNIIEDIRTSLPGRHNVENAVAACAVTRLAGGSEEALREGLRSFKGIARRFETMLKNERIVIIDDYAHHPTELDAAIGAARELYPGKTVRGVFQPHLFSRTQDFAAGFARALDALDEAVLIPIYPARELPIPGVTSGSIFDLMTLAERQLLSDEEMLHWAAELTDGVLLLLGAGDIDKLVPKVTAHHQNTPTHG